ncbi:unnamed protein product [Rhizopus microsporus]|uniref:Uncharacterized protein n=1 Tax=Rhizopus microsporus TaxID=58291 RepID=A0A0A1P8I3_RHIZD|nr:hypothetical protein BCV71DRAFT_228441 [Rhizopus microsporus]CEJ00359.1 hypothetical protein RMCBS344292_14416 [Rhizopus microsporus]
MWGGLFEKLFRRTKLRYKWGESVGGSSGAADSPGFKVDLRVIKDTLSRRNKEADTDNMELARMGASVVKTCSDKSKLLIESKCILDCLVREHPEQACNTVVPALQIVDNNDRPLFVEVVGSWPLCSCKGSNSFNFKQHVEAERLPRCC